LVELIIHIVDYNIPDAKSTLTKKEMRVTTHQVQAEVEAEEN
jgi:hypothetical protein